VVFFWKKECLSCRTLLDTEYHVCRAHLANVEILEGGCIVGDFMYFWGECLIPYMCIGLLWNQNMFVGRMCRFIRVAVLWGSSSTSGGIQVYVYIYLYIYIYPCIYMCTFIYICMY